jgi:hypothetical protein
MTPRYTKRKFSLQPINLWLQVLDDYIYDFSHKLLLWILFVKNHSHILMGHVTSRWWGGNKMEGVNFHHIWLMTKWCGHPIVITMIKKWLQVIWYEHKQPYPLPTYLPTYPTMHPLTYLPITYPPTHIPTHLSTLLLPSNHSLYDISTICMACLLWLVLNDYRMKNALSNIQWLFVLCYLSITSTCL